MGFLCFAEVRLQSGKLISFYKKAKLGLEVKTTRKLK